MMRPSFFSENLNGFIDEGTEFVGELKFRDTFRIDGTLRGRIVSDNMLVVGENGVVEAEIDCGVVSIRGRVRGHVRARDRIEILAGARVEATLDSPRMIVEEGASLTGQTDVGSKGL
ncbi:MAG: polymer-forming cytoskeletal protein [Vicinamibacteria bacterium]|nr:polymer-forming cytoskeletal protein [Vicinamibacteria bacterium]